MYNFMYNNQKKKQSKFHIFCIQHQIIKTFFFLFFISVLFYEHSQSTGQKGKGHAISLVPLCNFHSVHRHLGITQAITIES